MQVDTSRIAVKGEHRQAQGRQFVIRPEVARLSSD
jgi:hypothetical protein